MPPRATSWPKIPSAPISRPRRRFHPIRSEEPLMDIDPKLTVAEILALHPEARPALAALGLDACCGGKHPLEFACRAHGVPVETALDAIRKVVAKAPSGGPRIDLQAS